MKRRSFILTAAVAGTVFLAAVLFKWNYGLKWKKSPLSYPLILSGFCDEETIRNIGISYRAIVPGENSKVKLLALLTNGINDKQLQSADSSEVTRQLEMKVEQDFKAENITILKGWVISETEARQCALLSLL